MSNVTTEWTARDGTGPQTITESHMLKPGELAYFRKPGISIINLGTREAGAFLLGSGVITADVPIARTMMTKTAADWIAKTVLTKTYLKSHGGLALVRVCGCQFGTCGHCNTGEHDKCTTRVGFKGNPNPDPLTYVIDRSGSALTSVWPATGQACRWFCPCTTCAEKPADQVPSKPAYRKARGDLVPGDTVWLTPKTLAAPPVCWLQPRATVVSIERDTVYVTVSVDGTQHRIHVDNIRRSDPHEVPRPRAPRQPAKLPEGYEAGTLF